MHTPFGRCRCVDVLCRAVSGVTKVEVSLLRHSAEVCVWAVCTAFSTAGSSNRWQLTCTVAATACAWSEQIHTNRQSAPPCLATDLMCTHTCMCFPPCHNRFTLRVQLPPLSSWLVLLMIAALTAGCSRCTMSIQGMLTATGCRWVAGAHTCAGNTSKGIWVQQLHSGANWPDPQHAG